jgi:hypothetical protein
MLPAAVRAQVLSVEGNRVMDVSLNATGMVSALDSTRLLSAFPSELTLSQLQRLAVSSAAVVHRALMREDGMEARMNTIQLVDDGASDARLTALEATIQGLTLAVETSTLNYIAASMDWSATIAVWRCSLKGTERSEGWRRETTIASRGKGRDPSGRRRRAV